MREAITIRKVESSTSLSSFARVFTKLPGIYPSDTVMSYVTPQLSERNIQ